MISKFLFVFVAVLTASINAHAVVLNATNPKANLEACGGTASLEGEFVWLRDVTDCKFAFVNGIWVRDLKLQKDGKMYGRILLPSGAASVEVAASSNRESPFDGNAFWEVLTVER